MSALKVKFSRLRNQIRTFTANSSLHGLSIVGDENAWIPRRIFWALIILACLVLVIIQGLRLLYLAKHPNVQTSVIIASDDFPVQLPALTICNENVYKRSVKQQCDWKTDSECQKRVAHQLGDMVLECGQYLNTDLNCTAMFTPVTTDMGVCYTFNSDPHDPLHADYMGSYAAWYFLLNVEEGEYEYTEYTSGAVGFKMLVHRQEDLPKVRDGGFSVAPGEKTSIALTRSRVVMDKGMGCYNTSDPYFRNPLVYHNIYTYRSCTVECFTMYGERKCGCRVDVVKGKAKICITSDEVYCFSEMFGHFFRDPLGARTCRCPHECSTLEYEVKISHSRYPSWAAMKEFSRKYNMSKAQQRANLARVELYYENLHVRTTKLSFDYGFASLGGDLGGYMGLMLGASILSVMELADFLLRCLYTAVSPTKQTIKVEELNDK